MATPPGIFLLVLQCSVRKFIATSHFLETSFWTRIGSYFCLQHATLEIDHEVYENKKVQQQRKWEKPVGGRIVKCYEKGK